MEEKRCFEKNSAKSKKDENIFGNALYIQK